MQELASQERHMPDEGPKKCSGLDSTVGGNLGNNCAVGDSSPCSTRSNSGAGPADDSGDAAAKPQGVGKRAAVKVGNYILLSNIGKGSSSEVKLGQHVVTSEQVAIKVMSKEWIRSKGLASAVTTEINLLSTLKHRNVVELKEVMNSNSAVYMVLELVRGRELYEEIVEQGVLPEQQARKYFKQIVDGVSYLHSQGVSHRDLKPENILISTDGVVKITDFGMSATCGSARGHRRQHTVCGTPYYTAPEVFGLAAPAPSVAGAPPHHHHRSRSVSSGLSSYDARGADIWSAGVVLFTMLEGRLPFEGTSPEHALTLISTQELAIPAHFSQEARDLVSRMLTKDASKRITLEAVACHPWLANRALGDTPPDAPMDTAAAAAAAMAQLALEEGGGSGGGAAAVEERSSPPVLLSPASSVGTRSPSVSPRSTAELEPPQSSAFWLAGAAALLPRDAVPPAKSFVPAHAHTSA